MKVSKGGSPMVLKGLKGRFLIFSKGNVKCFKDRMSKVLKLSKVMFFNGFERMIIDGFERVRFGLGLRFIWFRKRYFQWDRKGYFQRFKCFHQQRFE